MEKDRKVHYTKFFLREEVARLTSAPYITIDRWSKTLRETDLVFKIENRVVYSELFVLFIRGRINTSGPPGLPEPERIAELLDLYTQGLTSSEIAEHLDDNFITIEAQLMALNLERERV